MKCTPNVRHKTFGVHFTPLNRKYSKLRAQRVLMAAFTAAGVVATHEVVVLNGVFCSLHRCLERTEAEADRDVEAAL